MNITVANAADGESSDPSSDDTPVKSLTETDKSNSTSDINVATKIVPEAQALPSDTVTENEKVVQTVDTKSNESSAAFSVNAEVAPNLGNSAQTNSKEILKSTPEKQPMSAAEAIPAETASHEVTTETTSVSNAVAPSVTVSNEINEFPVPDINQQSQVFSVNSQNSPTNFGSTYGSKSDDLNVLIQGLETLNNQVVTNNNPHLGQYKNVLTNIITPKREDSSIVPENEELQTNSAFIQLSSLRNNQELQNKFTLISDVSRYINHIYGVLKGYQTEAESLKEGKSKSSHIEGMSSIISDMTYGKNNNEAVENASNDETPSITDAISKLPSFNEMVRL